MGSKTTVSNTLPPDFKSSGPQFWKGILQRMSETAIDPINLDKLSIDTLRLLAADGVQKANSGHPGAPMALSPIAYLLFNKLMRHNPAHSKWTNRDRFVLSNGHASMLLYGTLFLSGYKLPLEELMRFRQW